MVVAAVVDDVFESYGDVAEEDKLSGKRVDAGEGNVVRIFNVVAWA